MQFSNSNLSNGSGQGSSKYPKGVFVDLVSITKIENTDSKYNDCNLFIEAEADRAKYPKKFYLGGNHHKDGKSMLDWGSGKNDTTNGSWKVCAFIEKVTGKTAKEIELNDDGTIEQGELERMVGKEVYILQYESNGKYARDTWFFFASKDEGADYLLEKWSSMTPPKYYKHQSSNKALSGLWNEGASMTDSTKDIESNLPF